MAPEKLQHRFATIAQHKRLTRVLYVSLYSLLGGSLGVLFTRFIVDVKLENWLRFPAVIALASCLILLYEGHRRYRATEEAKHGVQVRDLWLSALSVSAMSFLCVLPLGSLALHLPRWMGGIVLGLYVGIAMIGMLMFDFIVRPRVATYQVIAAICCSAVLYVLISLLRLSPSEDRSIVLHALVISISLAIAYAVIPRYFEDMCVYVIGGSDPKVRAKLMKFGSGLWPMANGQRQMDIVDATVNAVTDPKAILLPEVVVPKVASIRRKDRQFVLELHEENNDIFRRGEVQLDDEVLMPNREYVLKYGSRIRVGSLILGVIVPRSGILAASLLVLLGGAAHGEERPLLPSYQKWYQCQEGESDPFPVILVGLTAEPSSIRTTDLTIKGMGDGVTPVIYHYRPLDPTLLTDVQSFVTTATIKQGGKDSSEDIYYLVLVDYSGSMGWSASSNNKQVPFAQSRWMEVMRYLDLSKDLFSDNTVLSNFDCWGPSKDDVAKMNFTAQFAAVLASWQVLYFFSHGAAANDFFGIKSPARASAAHRDTRLFATLVSALQGLIERTKQSPKARFKLILFSDGLNDETHCPAPAPYMLNPGDGTVNVMQPDRIGCPDVHRELENARQTGRIDVVLVTHAPTADSKESLATCVKWKYPNARCAPCKADDKSCTSFPRLCAATADKASWSELLVSVGRDTIEMGPRTELFLRPDEMRKNHAIHFAVYQKEGEQQLLLAQTLPGGYAYELGDISRLPKLTAAGICHKLARIPVQKAATWPWFYFLPPALLVGLMLFLLWRTDGYLSQRFFT